MKLLHQIVGLSFVVVFLLTGQYMDFRQPPVSELDEGARMMFRSRHLYVLLAGLVNLALGIYLSGRRARWRRALQAAGSALVVAAPLLLLAAFFREPGREGLPREFTLPAMNALLAGVLLHFLSGAREARS